MTTKGQRVETFIILLAFAFAAVASFAFPRGALAEQAPASSNLALGKPYTTSEPPDYPGPISASTDGYLGGIYGDGNYGYSVEFDTTRVIYVTIDLGVATSFNRVRTLKYHGSHHYYSPDRVTVSTSLDGSKYAEVGKAEAAEGIWHEVKFNNVTARYLRVGFSKTNTGAGDFNDGNGCDDWLFIDEIEVYNDPRPVAASVKFTTRTLNLKSQGNEISCNISLRGLSVSEIDVSTIRLSVRLRGVTLPGVSIAVQSSSISGNDKNKNKPAEMTVRFSRQQIANILTAGDYEFVVRGRTKSGQEFVGYDLVKVTH